MASANKTIEAVCGCVQRVGKVVMPFATVEHMLLKEYDDDDDFEQDLDSFVNSVDWADSFGINWSQRVVVLRGPVIPYGADL